MAADDCLPVTPSDADPTDQHGASHTGSPAERSTSPSAGSPADSRAVEARTVRGGVVLAALGVVFGDIGTSPLYAMQAAFSLHGALDPNPREILGVVSLILWTLVLIVTVKYVFLVMRADNDGEGGVIALAALARRSLAPRSQWGVRLMIVGVIGAALFYGDGFITPAISVLSAVEGVRVIAPSITEVVPVIAAVIVAGLFLLQRHGTERIGRVFGPIMALWFLCLAVLGVVGIASNPSVLVALLPTTALSFVVAAPGPAFLVLGAVVLAVTGAEALYADMGHFGVGAIRRAWTGIVLPSLVLNYLGQAALLLRDPGATSNPFFLMAPAWSRAPLVVLATMAAIIASQAVITGAFSMTQQAVRFGLLPRVRVKHTSSTQEGQIFIPAVNTMLMIGVLALIGVFRSSARLSDAYGLAVTGTFLVTTVLLEVVARRRWKRPIWAIAAIAVGIGVPELFLFASNATKFASGGWLSVTIGAILFVIMLTWMRGTSEVVARRTMLAGDLSEFLRSPQVAAARRPRRTAVFLHAEPSATPLALRENVLLNEVLHERTVLVSVLPVDQPHVSEEDRVSVEHRSEIGGVIQVRIRQGFMDPINVPQALAGVVCAKDRARAVFFVSKMVFTIKDGGGAMPRWQSRLFVRLSKYSATPSSWFRLPPHRSVVIGTQIDV